MTELKNNDINKKLKKNKDVDKLKFKLDKELDKYDFKYKKNCFVAIILQESKNALITYVPNMVSFFNVANHTYFNVAQGKYLNNKHHVSVYLEGVMLPIEHNFIQYESVYTLYYNDEGQPVKDIDEMEKSDMKLLIRDTKGDFITNENGFFVIDIQEQVKGFDFDSKTSHVIFESNLTDRMAVKKSGKILPLLTIVTFLTFLLLLINIGVSYFY